MAIYYYDGVGFQAIHTDEEELTFPLDKQEVADVGIKVGNKVNNIITNNLIDKVCYYNPENVRMLSYILTDEGWRLITTLDMNVRPQGLHFESFVDINVKEVLNTIISDKFEDYGEDLAKNEVLDLQGVCSVIVKVVPNVKTNDTYNLSEDTRDMSSNIDYSTDIIVTHNTPNVYSVIDEFADYVAIDNSKELNSEAFVIIDIVTN